MLTLWNGYNTRRRLDSLARTLFEDALHGAPSVDRYRSYPPTTVKEEEGGLVLRSEVPGYGPENLDVTYEEGVLTLRGKHLSEEPVEGDEASPVTEEHVTFLRSYRLPSEVDEAGIRANLKHGILTVTLPYAEKPEPRTIAVELEG